MPARQPVPQLRYHKPTGQFYAWHDRHRVYLGSDRETADRRYREFVAGLVGPGCTDIVRTNQSPPSVCTDLVRTPTVAEALVLYRRHAEAYHAGQPKTLARVGEAAAAAAGLFATLPAERFRGPQLKAVRGHLLTTRASKKDGRPLSRTYVNALVACLQRAWRWLKSEELVTADCLAGVLAVERLRRGKGGAEPGRVLPPPPGWEVALAFAPPTIAAMARVQALAGMRPQDACAISRERVSANPAERVELPGTGRFVSALACGSILIWLYVPEAHKTSHLGKPRVIPLGPKAQMILMSRLERGGYFFRPADALAEAGRGCRWEVRGYYTPDVYSQAIRRAILRARRAGKECPDWSPGELRHLAATEIGERFDRHHAAAVLGHSGAGAIDFYLEQSVGKAARVAAEMG
jgi:integrase